MPHPATWRDARLINKAGLSAHAMIPLRQALDASGLPVGTILLASLADARLLKVSPSYDLPPGSFLVGTAGIALEDLRRDRAPGAPGWLKIDYLYRDSSNYKQHGSVIFDAIGSPGTEDAALSIVATAFATDEFGFNPADFGMPNLLEASGWDYCDEVDDDYHELVAISIVDAADAGKTADASFENLLVRCRAHLRIKAARMAS